MSETITPFMQKGNLTIGNPQGGKREQETFTIEIVDETSRTRFLSVEISPHDFMMALHGRSFVPVVFELRAARVGYRHETCEEVIEFPEPAYSRASEAQKEIARGILKDHALTKAGWEPRADDLFNHHRSVAPHAQGIRRQRVTFFRYVHPETGEVFGLTK